MTKSPEAEFKKVGRQEGKDDPNMVAKLFNPTGAGTWYATEMYGRGRDHVFLFRYLALASRTT
jgi:hypothetical protein